jgi:hypothetical protein
LTPSKLQSSTIDKSEETTGSLLIPIERLQFKVQPKLQNPFQLNNGTSEKKASDSLHLILLLFPPPESIGKNQNITSKHKVPRTIVPYIQ